MPSHLPDSPPDADAVSEDFLRSSAWAADVTKPLQAALWCTPSAAAAAEPAVQGPPTAGKLQPAAWEAGHPEARRIICNLQRRFFFNAVV